MELKKGLNKLFVALLVGCCLMVNPACSDQEDGALATITLENSSSQERSGTVVEIPYEKIASRLEGVESFRVTEAGAGTEVAYQLEYRGEETPVNLLVLVNLPAGGEQTLKLVAGTPDSVSAKTYARYVPERMDDFAWENNKIAFRMYGKALEGTPGDAHGIDVWVKRTPNLVIDKWYKSGDYHKDHGDGMDYYSVGMTLGAGDIVPFTGDTLWFPKHYRGHQVLDNGPLRSTFRLDYEQWDAGGQPVKVSKLISLDAGSRLNRVEVLFESPESRSFPAAIGIVQRSEPGEHLMDKEAGIMGYWEPQHGDDGITAVGVVTEGPVRDIKLDQGHLLGVVDVTPGEPLVYYLGAAWNKAGEITSAEEWFDYLRTFRNEIGVHVE